MICVKCTAFEQSNPPLYNTFDADVMELVDIGDSKSPALTSVAVRVRPSVPYTTEPEELMNTSGFFVPVLFGAGIMHRASY